MTSKKNIAKFLLVLVISIVFCYVCFKKSIINIEKILLLEEGFHYNAISMSAIIAGFSFTGISILISAIDKERIKRLWEHNYLDNLYRSAITGIIFNLITIISAIVILIVDIKTPLKAFAIKFEISSLLIGLIFFIWCVWQLIFVISRMKNNGTNSPTN